MHLIYISGIDGCGKTTQSLMIVDWLKSQGHSAEYQWLRWEPSIVLLLKAAKSVIGKKSTAKKAGKHKESSIEDASHVSWSKLKSKLLSSRLFRKLWLAYATWDYARAYRKASREWKSDFIIMDRYILDFIIDQSINFGVCIQDFQDAIAGTAVGKMKAPDLSILIDIPAEVGFRRKMDGTALEYLKERRDSYLQLEESSNLHKADGTDPVESVNESIKTFIKARISL